MLLCRSLPLAGPILREMLLYHFRPFFYLLPFGPYFGKCCSVIHCLWLSHLANIALLLIVFWSLLWEILLCHSLPLAESFGKYCSTAHGLLVLTLGNTALSSIASGGVIWQKLPCCSLSFGPYFGKCCSVTAD